MTAAGGATARAINAWLRFEARVALTMSEVLTLKHIRTPGPSGIGHSNEIQLGHSLANPEAQRLIASSQTPETQFWLEFLTQIWISALVLWTTYLYTGCTGGGG